VPRLDCFRWLAWKSTQRVGRRRTNRQRIEETSNIKGHDILEQYVYSSPVFERLATAK